MRFARPIAAISGGIALVLVILASSVSAPPSAGPGPVAPSARPPAVAPVAGSPAWSGRYVAAQPPAEVSRSFDDEPEPALAPEVAPLRASPEPPDEPEVAIDRAPVQTGDPPSAIILVAGDIASCAWQADSATAQLVEDLPGIVMTAGDNAYQEGTYRQFRDCYDPTWGRFSERTRPTPGNHDWYTTGARGYFRYFGDLAGPAGRGYYAFDAGAWRVYALASDCSDVGGCRKGSPQHTWLKQDLAAHPTDCVLAVWHQPRFSSGPHGDSKRPISLLQRLHRSGADVVVNGHDHIYERFAPARPDGTRDRAYGVRQFIVGTGGGPLYRVEQPYAPNSQVRDATSHGVLRLTLEADGYTWEFMPVPGDTLRDAGSGTCHAPPP